MNLKAITSAVRMMSSGLTKSMCVTRLEAAEIVCRLLDEVAPRGRSMRHLRENLESSESRMQTANAIVSRGSAARVRMDWTRQTDGEAMDAEGG